MARNNTAKKQGNNSPVASLPPNAIALRASTDAILTVGKKYAIKNPTRYEDDPQDVLTEDIFRFAVPEGYFVVQAVAPRHYVAIKYNVADPDVEAGALMGGAPVFNEPVELGQNPNRTFISNGNTSKDALLRERSHVASKATRQLSTAHAISTAGIQEDKYQEGSTEAPEAASLSNSGASGSESETESESDLPSSL